MNSKGERKEIFFYAITAYAHASVSSGAGRSFNEI